MDQEPKNHSEKMVYHAAHVEGNPRNLNFTIEIPSVVMDPKLTSFAHERGYASKDKFHPSVISFANQRKLNDLGDPDIFSKIKQLADQYQWHYSLEPEYFIVEKFYDRTELEKSGYGPDVPEHLRKTIIQQAHIQEIVDFYHKLSELTGIAFDVPFSHLTLFSWSSYEPFMKQGIGLNSQADFDRYCKGDISIV